MRYLKKLIFLFILVYSFPSVGDSFCFASAGSYYEQIYCELQAKGEKKNLPPFYQFKRNDPMTQALLLKRPAARIGIDLPMPKSARKAAPVDMEKKLPATNSQSIAKTTPAAKSTPGQSTADPTTSNSTPVNTVPKSNAQLPNTSGCQFSAAEIRCGAQSYQLTGNLHNKKLAENALTDENKMDMAVFQGDINNSYSVEQYLATAYQRYIEKMHEIGLGGVTMTYGKFHFLFYDVTGKGLNFSQRFETMYEFLKKDKTNMAVSEKLNLDEQLTMGDCDTLSENMLVCSRAGRNYLYLAVSQ